MKRLIAASALSLLGAMFFVTAAMAQNVGVNSCGYTMEVIPATQGPAPAATDVPQILDAWTTNDPFVNPYSRVNDFTSGQGTLAFVVDYHHTGGTLPRQYNRAWSCGNEANILKTCSFRWTIPFLPAGDYLLVNYVAPVNLKPGSYDWAAKVGDVVFGWPDINASAPSCFTIQ
ncbi:MAG: hypothetical protein HY893_08085 [Deltaproteobacteria bacterium]|nr:hypothetical protein [Deltaproteobacteria bacterium]